jgi:hypothetical protein
MNTFLLFSIGLGVIVFNKIKGEMFLVLRNKTLKYWISNDLPSLKRISQFRMQTYEKINSLYHRFVSYYYDASLQYYTMSDEDKELLSNLLDLMI